MPVSPIKEDVTFIAMEQRTRVHHDTVMSEAALLQSS
jgi:hypothetical protein